MSAATLDTIPPGSLVLQRSFTYSDIGRNSNKAWTCEVYVHNGSTPTVYESTKTGLRTIMPGMAIYRSLFSRIGARPQEDPHVFATEAAARAYAEKKIAEKLGKDYRETGAPLLRAVLTQAGSELAAHLALSDAISLDQVSAAQKLLQQFAQLWVQLGPKKGTPAGVLLRDRLVAVLRDYYKQVPTVLVGMLDPDVLMNAMGKHLGKELDRIAMLRAALTKLAAQASGAAGAAQKYALPQIMTVLAELNAPAPAAIPGVARAQQAHSFVGALDLDDDE